MHPTDAASLDQAWAPREIGIPFSSDDSAWNASAKGARIGRRLLESTGKHTWDSGNQCRAWDFATYGNGVIARFFSQPKAPTSTI